jgi:phosphoglycolate phosphatase-like HAD superfamily hydrolase
MKKKIIFFDGDGTLWYPKTTKRTQKPHWVYHDELTKDNYLEHIELAPGTRGTLEWLHNKGIYLVVISANPYDEKIAVKEIKERIDHFGLSDLFYSYRASEGSNPRGKVAVMFDLIKELGLIKEDALMVGDSYFYDYAAPKEAGIDAFFIENDVSKMPDIIPADLQRIKEVSDLVHIIN